MKVRYLIATIVTGGALAAGAMSAASAATSTNPPTHTNVGTSGIPRTVFQQERLSVVAEVLKTTTVNVQAAHKDKTMGQLISGAGLTKKTFHQQVTAQLTSDLEAKGYSQDQVTIALQHRTIHHLRHHTLRQGEDTTKD